MKTPQRRNPVIPLIIGSIMVLAGLVLAGPRWRLGAWGTVVDAYVTDVLPEPLGDGSVHLKVMFEYGIESSEGNVRVLGFGEIDLNGETSDGPIVDADEAQAELRRLLPANGRRRIRPAIYDADDPFHSARLLSTQSDGFGLFSGSSARFNLGILLILTPFCLAFSTLLTRLLRGLLKKPRRERTKNTGAR